MDITKPQFLQSSLNTQSPLATVQQTPTQNSSQPSQNSQPTQISQPTDYGALTLARSIALQESSKDGHTPNYTATGDAGTSYGAYQWNNGKQPLKPGQLPTNFTDAAKEFGLDPNDFSPVNQDKVAYSQVMKMKQQGLQPEQIAAAWNAGMGHVNDWQNHKGTTVINGQMVNYDTPGYVNKVKQYYSQLSQSNPPPQNQTSTDQPVPSGTPESPSVGGFSKNVVQSGANFVGNIGNAVLHPIQTVQNIGGAAVGGIQELGGQQNENTAKFDNLVGYFKQRYGGVDQLLHTAYTDPVGLAADVSAALGVGGGIAGAVGKGAELGGLGELATAGSEGVAATEGSGVAGALGDTAKVLGKGSELTNPLTPLVKGAGALLNKTKNINDIIANPSNYTPEDIANSSAEKVSSDVQEAFDAKEATLSDTGSGYTPFKKTPTLITTTPDSLDNILRDALKVDVTDGVIKQTSTSLLRDQASITKLQGVYNTYKTDFLNGTMDSEKFLNMRSDLGDIAYNDLGIKNTKVASAAEDVRNSLNTAYREQVKGLSELDSNYSTQKSVLRDLKDGLVTKTGSNAGELKSSFISKALKAAKNGDTATLDQLEQVLPGITKRLQVMQTLKDLGNAYSPLSLTEKAGTVGALVTGNYKAAAAGFASIILSKPEIAVPLMRAVGANIDLVKGVMANLAKFTTLSAVGQNAVSTPSQEPSQQSQTDQNTGQGLQQPSQTSNQNGTLSSPKPTISEPELQSLAKEKKFNLEAARKDGHTDEDIYNFLKS